MLCWGDSGAAGAGNTQVINPGARSSARGLQLIVSELRSASERLLKIVPEIDAGIFHLSLRTQRNMFVF